MHPLTKLRAYRGKPPRVTLLLPYEVPLIIAQMVATVEMPLSLKSRATPPLKLSPRRRGWWVCKIVLVRLVAVAVGGFAEMDTSRDACTLLAAVDSSADSVREHVDLRT